jgi:hypothetical protein
LGKFELHKDHTVNAELIHEYICVLSQLSTVYCRLTGIFSIDLNHFLDRFLHHACAQSDDTARRRATDQVKHLVDSVTLQDLQQLVSISGHLLILQAASGFPSFFVTKYLAARPGGKLGIETLRNK